jgi:sec-independent protein translocase protein TatC
MAERTPTDDPDDFFADTRMSFGDHLDELRFRLMNALKGLVFFLMIGFVLDGVGMYMNWPNFGIGRPIFAMIKAPVEDMVRDYYFKHNEKAVPKLDGLERLSPDDAARIQKYLDDHEGHIAALSESDRQKLLGKVEAMPIFIRKSDLEKVLGKQSDSLPDEIALPIQVYPAYQSYLAAKGEALLKSKNYVTTLSVQEPFLVYMKVSLLCGIILGSPYIFYQIWAFVGAGLYPHEKRYVHVYLPASIILFLTGCLLCQFLVVPNAVQSLLGLNNFLGVDPDIRLDEWLSFAVLLPLVFGVSFQTPLVMMFLNRIGIFTHEDYLAYWKVATFFLFLGAVIILPTPDLLSVLYLFVPMMGLYVVGILICKYFPADRGIDPADESSQVAV